MELLHIIVLSLIQGLTEFLPISSSAHLILPSEMLGWPDQGMAFDVAVHVGSLLAVLLYFRKDILQLRSEEHTSELQSRPHLVCRLLLEKKNYYYTTSFT